MKRCKPHSVYPDFSCTVCHEKEYNADRIFELADKIFKREKKLSKVSIADLGYIKLYAQAISKAE